MPGPQLFIDLDGVLADFNSGVVNLLGYEPELLDTVQEDSANLKEKIQLALDPETTVEEIQNSNI